MNGTFDPSYKASSVGELSPRQGTGIDASSSAVVHNSSLWEASLKKYFRPGRFFQYKY